jgi:hypothetical protein
MATTVHSQKIWQPQGQNQAGLRRLKLTDADNCQVLVPMVPAGTVAVPVGYLLPTTELLTWYEFVFPTDQACGLQVQKQNAASGDVFYTQTISFQLPQLAAAVTDWEYRHRHARWIALAEDWNGMVYILGHQERGLIRNFQAGTGNMPRDRNQHVFSFSSEQLVPYYGIASYEDAILFPEAAFTYGFSLGYNS